MAGAGVEHDGRTDGMRTMIGGNCGSCGRVAGKTVFCMVCGVSVCWTCLNGTACKIRDPDGYRWCHATAMRIREEERSRHDAEKHAEAGSASVMP